MTHTNCTHPVTKAGRAACRKARNARAADLAAQVEALIDAYDANEGDAEEIALGLAALLPEVHTAYYDLSLDMEEVIATARSL